MKSTRGKGSWLGLGWTLVEESEMTLAEAAAAALALAVEEEEVVVDDF